LAHRSHRIVFLDRSTVSASFRKPSFPHTWIEHGQTKEVDVDARIDGATIVITNKVPLTARNIERAERLLLIAVAATGTNIIDLDTARHRVIAVANVRAYATNAVPEHVMMMVLALRRNLRAYQLAVSRGEWNRADSFCLLGPDISELAGTTFGVVGYGSLGRATAKLAEAFGMRVLIAEHKNAPVIRPGRTPFSDVVKNCDILSLHAPLSAKTHHLISAPELRAMKSTALLINTARGGLVDELALKDAVLSRAIGGIGIDVLEIEPPRSGSPILDLAERPEVIVTPHIAWASKSAMQALADQVIDNLEAFVRGEPRNLV
jgi:glycerate dehydrogenase